MKNLKTILFLAFLLFGCGGEKENKKIEAASFPAVSAGISIDKKTEAIPASLKSNSVIIASEQDSDAIPASATSEAKENLSENKQEAIPASLKNDNGSNSSQNPTYAIPASITFNDAENSMAASGSNFSLLLTDKPLKELGIEKVIVRIKQITLVPASSSGSDTVITKFLYKKPETTPTTNIENTPKPDNIKKEDNAGTETATSVDTNNNSGSDSSLVISKEPKEYDLLSLQNGITSLLGEAKIPAGEYSQIRVILEETNLLVINGVEVPLKVPSGTSSGIKISFPFKIEENSQYIMVLDFNAEESVHETSKDNYSLSPVIKVKSFEPVIR